MAAMTGGYTQTRYARYLPLDANRTQRHSAFEPSKTLGLIEKYIDSNLNDLQACSIIKSMQTLQLNVQLCAVGNLLHCCIV
jgi:hypothetical protein